MDNQSSLIKLSKAQLIVDWHWRFETIFQKKKRIAERCWSASINSMVRHKIKTVCISSLAMVMLNTTGWNVTLCKFLD